MTLYEFNMLNEENRYSVIWNKGTHLDSIIIKNDRIALYAIDRFFVEVYYDNETNKLIKSVSFKQGERLNKYSNIQTSY